MTSKEEGLSISIDVDKTKKDEFKKILRGLGIKTLTKKPRDLEKFPIDKEGELILKQQFNKCVDDMHIYFPYCSIVKSCQSLLRNKKYKNFIKELMRFDETTNNQVTTSKYDSIFGELYFGLDLKIGCATSQKYVYNALDELYGGRMKFYEENDNCVQKYKNRKGRSVILNLDEIKAKKEIIDKKNELLKNIRDNIQSSFSKDVFQTISKEPTLLKMIELLITIKIYVEGNNKYNNVYGEARKIAFELDLMHYCTDYQYNGVSFRVIPQNIRKLSIYDEIIEILSQRDDSIIKTVEFKNLCIQYAIKERKENIEMWRFGSYIDNRDYMENEVTEEEY